jgi:hypothetical protein
MSKLVSGVCYANSTHICTTQSTEFHWYERRKRRISSLSKVPHCFVENKYLFYQKRRFSMIT